MTTPTLLERLDEACDPKGYANMSKALVVGLREAVIERDRHEATIRAISGWLEANQPDVFRRGLWDAIGNARKAST